MTKRFCGDVTIEIVWKDFDGGRWKVQVRSAGTSWKGTIRFEDITNRDLGVNHSIVYDTVALRALSLAMREDNDDCKVIADAAASGIVDGMYKIERKREAEPALTPLEPRMLRDIPPPKLGGYEGV